MNKLGYASLVFITFHSQLKFFIILVVTYLIFQFKGLNHLIQFKNVLQVKYFKSQYSRLPFIWLVWDLSDAELPEIPDYRVIHSVIAKRASVAP